MRGGPPGRTVAAAASVLAVAAAAFAVPASAAPTSAELCARRASNGDVAVCQRAIAENPGDATARRNLATAWMALGDYDSAVEAFREIVARAPRDTRGQYDLASMLGFVRRYAEAVAPIEAVLRAEPDNIAALKLAAMVYHQIEREPDSFRATRRAAELGDRTAMYDMIWHYENGKGVAADPRAALAWTVRAAEAGHIAAMDAMVETYQEGLYGEAPDDSKAESWAMRARLAREAE